MWFAERVLQLIFAGNTLSCPPLDDESSRLISPNRSVYSRASLVDRYHVLLSAATGYTSSASLYDSEHVAVAFCRWLWRRDEPLSSQIAPTHLFCLSLQRGQWFLSLGYGRFSQWKVHEQLGNQRTSIALKIHIYRTKYIQVSVEFTSSLFTFTQEIVAIRGYLKVFGWMTPDQIRVVIQISVLLQGPIIRSKA